MRILNIDKIEGFISFLDDNDIDNSPKLLQPKLVQRKMTTETHGCEARIPSFIAFHEDPL